MNISSSIIRCLCVPTTVIVAVVVALLVFVALPLREKIATESDDIQKLHAKIENEERKISRLPELAAQFAVVKEDERKIARLLPESRVVDFIREVEEVADRLGGEVSIAQGAAADATKKKPAPKEKTPVGEGDADGGEPVKKVQAPKTIVDSLSWEKRLPLNVEFSGEYGKAVNFLHKIETMEYRLDVISIGIRPIVPDENDRRSSDVFSAAPVGIPVDPALPAPVPVPVEPEKPKVSATFAIIVYME